jgi:DNA-directed RNA polymerase specialized sigma24 family protein
LASLVRAFQSGDERAFRDLLDRLRPMLVSFAKNFGPTGSEDDAVQEASIRIWHKIEQRAVDLSRESTVRQFLCNAAVFAIKTLNSRMRRQNRRFEDRAKVDVVPPSCDLPDLPPTVALYFDYIVENGTVLGAHAAIGRKLGINKGSAFRRFHAEAKSLTESL